MPIIRSLSAATVMLLALLSLTCNETLPVYQQPQNVLSLSVTKIEQVNDHISPPTRPLVHIVLTGENTFDEVMLDSVDIKGTMTIWWKRKPTRSRTITLTQKNLIDRSLVQNGKMMLVPGQQFTMEAYWDVRSDDGVLLVSEMNFARLRQRICAANVACSDPEDFVIEVSLNVYNRLGFIAAPPKDFFYIGRACICPSFPPCGPGGDC